MDTETPNNGTTRRSFIKRSVVAAVAVSSMTIFSGLVNAQTSGQSGTGIPWNTCNSGHQTRCCTKKFGNSTNGYTCDSYPGYYCDANRKNVTSGSCPPDPPEPPKP